MLERRNKKTVLRAVVKKKQEPTFLPAGSAHLWGADCMEKRETLLELKNKQKKDVGRSWKSGKN